MKIIKLKSIATLIVFLLLGTTAQAQFWKKIKERAREAAEETVLNKTAEKAAEKTDKTMEKIFDLDFGKTSKIDPAILQNTYEYNWRYTLEMQHKKGAMKINYLLREGGTDFGSSFEMDQGTQIMGGMLMVMDEAAGVTAILMERNGKKFGQVMSSITDEILDIQEQQDQENQIDEFEFKKIGTKEILGYECQGFQMENEDTIMTMYLAFDTPVSFNQLAAGQNSKRLPKGFDPKWLDKIGDNSLMMEMDVVNKKKPKQSMKMSCVALDEEHTAISMAEYEFPQLKMQEQMQD
ncbi:MAG: DUF4412 domain-containing protein [Maribacter sp.]